MPSSNTVLPDIAQILAPVLQRVSIEQRPLLIAAAERAAAKRYREWSSRVSDTAMKASLLACADREDDIARRVESLFANAESLQKELLSRAPELTAAGSSLFGPLPLKDQFKLQAQGERIGAATWRAYASHSSDSKVRDTFLKCALLEEESAIFLESIADQSL